MVAPAEAYQTQASAPVLSSHQRQYEGLVQKTQSLWDQSCSWALRKQTFDNNLASWIGDESSEQRLRESKPVRCLSAKIQDADLPKSAITARTQLCEEILSLCEKACQVSKEWIDFCCTDQAALQQVQDSPAIDRLSQLIGGQSSVPIYAFSKFTSTSKELLRRFANKEEEKEPGVEEPEGEAPEQEFPAPTPLRQEYSLTINRIRRLQAILYWMYPNKYDEVPDQVIARAQRVMENLLVLHAEQGKLEKAREQREREIGNTLTPEDWLRDNGVWGSIQQRRPLQKWPALQPPFTWEPAFQAYFKNRVARIGNLFKTVFKDPNSAHVQSSIDFLHATQEEARLLLTCLKFNLWLGASNRQDLASKLEAYVKPSYTQRDIPK
jgi:hypothetical protein